ncbi:MAG: ATP-binding protein [Oscillospiraceae bacterium]|nr:ATP-binding protein [Oscillospiraceae bacterium]
MRIIPKNTRVKIEFYKGIDLPDAVIGLLGVILAVVLFTSNIPSRFWLMLATAVLFGVLLVRIDSEKTYMMLLNLFKHLSIRHVYTKNAPKKGADIRALMPFTGFGDGCIEFSDDYFAQVLEVPSVEFRFYSEHRQDTLIDRVLGSALRQSGDLMVNLVKLDRPVNYDRCIESEFEKIEALKSSYTNGLVSEDELKLRADVLRGRIEALQRLNTEKTVVTPCYYLVFFEKDKKTLKEITQAAAGLLSAQELKCRVLTEPELAAFCKYGYTLEFDEREAPNLEPEDYMDWIMPEKIEFFARRQTVDALNTYTLRISNYPTAVGNAWGWRLFDIPNTKVVMKMKPVDKYKAVRRIDRAIDELRSQSAATGKTSRVIELNEHIETLTRLLMLLQNDSETLFEVNIFLTIYEREKGERITVKKKVRRMLNEEGFRSEDMMFQQFDAYAGGCVSAYDPFSGQSRGIHSTSVAAVFPFVHGVLHDEKGIMIGSSGRTPVLIDFFKRDHDHVNSNMVIIGKSGSGKSFATKTILANLAAEDSKVFILDPENEYLGIAKKMGGKIIDVGSSKTGRLNPFHIVPSIDEEDEEADAGGANSSYSAHLQFLEEFFRQILPDIGADEMEILNTNISRTYESKGIDAQTNIAALKPGDFPTFDDLYDSLLSAFQTSQSDFGRENLRILLTHIAKFAGEGRNAMLWNGEATVTTNENFVVFNFQSLLANKNNIIANAQMLLVLKWLDNEIIKNRDYNIRYEANRKIIVVIDEAHVFIDTKYPIALDFMFQLAKRIRKYNGMQAVITQNIKDFVGSEEIARKSTAIINASQYSFIFALAPNDMHDLCRLYEKAGAINESEQEEIINNGRGQAFVVTSPGNRTRVRITASKELQKLF